MGSLLERIEAARPLHTCDNNDCPARNDEDHVPANTVCTFCGEEHIGDYKHYEGAAPWMFPNNLFTMFINREVQGDLY